jgi:hypothetical protein
MTVVTMVASQLHFGYKEIMNLPIDKAIKFYKNANILAKNQEPK